MKFVSILLDAIPFLFLLVALAMCIITFKEHRQDTDREFSRFSIWILFTRFTFFSIAAVMALFLVIALQMDEAMGYRSKQPSPVIVTLEQAGDHATMDGPFPIVASMIVAFSLIIWLIDEDKWQTLVAKKKSALSGRPVRSNYFGARFLAGFCLIPVIVRLCIFFLSGL